MKIKPCLKMAKLPMYVSAMFAVSSINTVNAAQLEEVVVTATKRSQSLQDIPMSVSAVTGDSLERAGIQDFEDIANSVPSLSFKSAGPGRTKLNIRGISAATGFAPTVSYYIDEMPISSISSGSSTSFAQTVVSPKMFDLDRVEVLRGPQGTIFGSSSMGGTVRLITGQPNIDEFEAKVAGEISDTDEGGLNYTLNGMVNSPLTDKAALRVVASRTDNDGYIDRAVAGSVVEEDVNNEETTSVRASLRWELDDSSYIQPVVFTQNTEMNGKPNFDATAADNGTLTQNRDFDLAEPFEDDFTMTSLTYSKDFSGFSLLANVSNIDREFNNVENIAQPLASVGLPIFAGIAAEELVEQDDTTYEVRLSSNASSKVQWVAGLYRKDVDIDAGYRMQRGFEQTLVAIGATPFEGVANTQENKTYEESAIFGEATFAVSDKLDLTVGLRYLDYDFAQTKTDWGLVFGAFTQADATPLAVTAEDDSFNYRITLAWDYSETGQLYFTSSDATRPGGGNRSVPRSTVNSPATATPFACNNDLNALGIEGSPDSFDGDEVQNFELGWKADLSDSVRINAAAYRINWDDIQQVVNTSQACGINFTANLGEAESTGLEVELTAALSDNFKLTAGLGLTNAEFSETISLGGTNLVTDGAALPDVPETTFSISGDYTFPMEKGDFFLLSSLSYVDETLEIAGDENTDVSGNGIVQGNVRPSYTLLDLRLGYASHDNWEAALFIDNATNEEAFFSYSDVLALPTGTFDRTVRNRPRTIGVSFSYDF